MGLRKLAVGASVSFALEISVWKHLQTWLTTDDGARRELPYAKRKLAGLGAAALPIRDVVNGEVELLKRSLATMAFGDLVRAFRNSGASVEAGFERKTLISDLAEYEARVGKWLPSRGMPKKRKAEPRPKSAIIDEWMPRFRHLLVSKSRALVECRLTLLSITLLEHFADRGRFPARLADLGVGKGAAALDPFVGRPFRYRVLGRGCVIYSVGPDLDDDRGEVVYGTRKAGQKAAEEGVQQGLEASS